MTALESKARLYPRPDVPRLSVGERDRRWARIRAAMAAAGIDVLFAPENTGKWDMSSAYVRYVTGFGSNCSMIAAVLSADRDATAITGLVPRIDYWLQFQDWVDDVRSGGFDLRTAIIPALRDHGAARGRIGIAGLSGLPRQPDGLVTHGLYLAIEEAFPDAEIVDATAMLDQLRFVKSDEEIALLREGVALADAAMEVLDREARAGIPECVVYARMMAAMVERGGELPMMLLWSAGHDPQPPTAAMHASRRPIEPRDVLTIEIDGKWAGYLGHTTHTAAVDPVDDEFLRLAAIQIELAERCWAAMQPGARIAELLDVCRAASAEHGLPCELVMHSRGLGHDVPVLIMRSDDARTLDWTLAANSVFVVKPRVSSADRSHHVIWGDTVVVGSDGAQRLGQRAPGLTVLQ